VKEYAELIANTAKSNCFSAKLISTEDIFNFTTWSPKFHQRGGFVT
jgi:hypothetical protein